jgi:putative membrane protein insertion efficiency factor
MSAHRAAALPGLLLAAPVRIYQWTVRPLIGSNCRFHPSCSDYALQALATHGAWRGSMLAAWRILRCNPWVAGGYDPVPPRREDESVAKGGKAN